MSLSEDAYATIRDRLVTLQIEPGAPIHEAAIAADLGMGRTPVREAIKRLELEGLIEVYSRRGTFASEIRITDLSALAELRFELEGYAAQLAAERLTPVAAEDLTRLLAELEANADSNDAAVLMDLDGRVHRFVYRCSQNPFLIDSLERLLNLSMRIWYLALDRLPGLSMRISDHVELLRAIEANDAQRARATAASHVEAFEREVGAVLFGRAGGVAGGHPQTI